MSGPDPDPDTDRAGDLAHLARRVLAGIDGDLAEPDPTYPPPSPDVLDAPDVRRAQTDRW